MTDQSTLAGLLLFGPVLLVALAATVSHTLADVRSMRQEQRAKLDRRL